MDAGANLPWVFSSSLNATPGQNMSIRKYSSKPISFLNTDKLSIYGKIKN